MADESSNLQIQKQLNRLLEDQRKIVRETTRNLEAQASLTKEIVESMNKANVGQDTVEKARSLSASLKGAAQEAKNFSENSADMNKAASESFEGLDDGFEALMGQYQDATKQASVWGTLTGGFVSTISSGFSLLKTGLSGVLSLAGSVAQGIFNIGKAVLSIPFKIFNAFVAEANRLQGEPLFRRELEETRKSFGDFGEDLSKNVIGGYKNLRGELAQTGLSTRRVLGYMHERLKFVREQLEALGAVAHQFGEEIMTNVEAIAAYQKGLGLTGEHMKGLAQLTQGTGEAFSDTLREATNFTTSLGKRFGISQKVIGRDIGEMSKDLKTFGSVGVREMAQLSTFARTLGADFKDLLGVVDRFDNFEDAAENAARLAQAFGMNVDAMEMMKTQEHGERIEQLRKAFYRTGKDITKLTRQERNYLTQTAGIEDQALNSVFALENQGKTYEDVAEAGQTAEQQQITQAEAMQKLSDSIERLVKSGKRTGGFFDRFMRGFKRGMRYSEPFRGIMRNIRISLKEIEIAGRRVGRAFVQMFPGMNKFLLGVKDFFDPKKFKILGDKVVLAFRQFFDDLGDPKLSKQALSHLLDNLKEAFMDMVGMQETAGADILGGFKEIFKAVGQIIYSALNTVMDTLSASFDAITTWLMDDGSMSLSEAFSQVFGTGADMAGGIFNDLLISISENLGESGGMLWGAFKDLVIVVWNKTTDFIGEKLQQWWKELDIMKLLWENKGVSLALATYMFGPQFIIGAGKLLGIGIRGLMKSPAVIGSAIRMGALVGPLLLNPIGAAVAAVAAIGGAYLYVKSKGEENFQAQRDFINAEISKTNELVKSKEALLVKSGLRMEDVKAIGSLEMSNMAEKIKLLEKENKLTSDQINLLREKKMVEENAKLAALRQKAELAVAEAKAEADLHGTLLGEVWFDTQTNLDRAEGNLKAIEFKIEQSRQRQFAANEEMREAERKAAEKEELENAPFVGPEMPKHLDTSEIFNKVNTIKRFSPIRIANIQRRFSKVKDMILSEGGLRDMMGELNREFMVSPEDLNAVKAIQDMVGYYNSIGEHLSNLSPNVRIKPRLEKLGKALGLRGSESLTIDHENFKVDINVVVELDPNKLTDSVASTGRMVKSIK